MFRLLKSTICCHLGSAALLTRNAFFQSEVRQGVSSGRYDGDV